MCGEASVVRVMPMLGGRDQRVHDLVDSADEYQGYLSKKPVASHQGLAIFGLEQLLGQSS